MDIAARLLDDDHEDVRAKALIPYYFYADDGSYRVIKALDDRAPIVRGYAFGLLSGQAAVEFEKDSWESKEVARETDALLTAEVVSRLLNDPDEIVFEVVTEAIAEGKVPSTGLRPHDVARAGIGGRESCCSAILSRANER